MPSPFRYLSLCLFFSLLSISGLHAQDADSLYKAAQEAYNNGRKDEGIKLLKVYAAKFPTLPARYNACLYVGYDYAERKMYDSALVFYMKGLGSRNYTYNEAGVILCPNEFANQDYKTYRGLGEVYYTLNKPDSAAKYFLLKESMAFAVQSSGTVSDQERLDDKWPLYESLQRINRLDAGVAYFAELYDLEGRHADKYRKCVRSTFLKNFSRSDLQRAWADAWKDVEKEKAELCWATYPPRCYILVKGVRLFVGLVYDYQDSSVEGLRSVMEGTRFFREVFK